MPKKKNYVADGRSLAKLIPPTLSAAALIARPRLFALLDRASKARRTVWVGAGPGAGKTTLVASYLSARGLRPFWVQIDEGDNDPATFFHYLGLGAQAADKRRRSALPHLGPEHLAQLGVFARRFFEELYGRLPSRSAVVLDNFNALAPDSAVNLLAAVGAECLPPDVALFVVSRSAPPAAFSRLLSEQRLVVVDDGPLRLTLAETGRLLGRSRAKGAPRLTAKQLHEAAGGWLAGTVLLANAAAEAVDRIATPDALAGYFDREVLAQLEPDARGVVLKTSLLPSMTAGMAEALSTVPAAGRVLVHLHSAGLFTERRHERPLRFQFHSLFREFLTSRLTLEAGADLAELRGRAAALLAADGQHDAAVALYVEAERFEAAAALVAGAAPALLRDGRSQQLLAWMALLPAALVEGVPWLAFWRGAALFGTNPNEAQGLLEGAFAAFEAAGEKVGAVLACAGVLDALWFAWRNPAALDEWSERLAAVVGNPAELPPELATVVTCSMFAALFWRRPGHPSCMQWAQRFERLLARATELDFRTGAAVVGLSNLYIYRGEITRAERLADRVSNLLRTSPPVAAAELGAFQARAVAAVVQGKAEEALALVERGLARGAAQGVESWNVPLLGVQGVGAIVLGDQRLARRTIEQMLAQPRDIPMHFRSWILSLESAIEREVGDTFAARSAAERALDLAVHEGPFPEALPRMTLALVYHDLERSREADEQVARLAAIAREMDSAMIEIAWRAIAARIAFGRADNAAGIEHLRAAFGRGAATGLVDWQGKLTRAEFSLLCAKALAADIEPTYARLLIRKRRLVPGPDAAHLEAWPWPIRIYTLGRFSLLRDGKPVVFSGKTQKRPLDLLKVLIAQGGRQVSQARIIEMLWPQGDAAAASFDMALKRLRDLLGADAITRTERKLTLNPAICWVDLWQFERALKAEPASGVDGIALYKGAFLRDEPEPWCVSARERVRVALVRYVRRQAEAREREGKWDDAAEWYERGLHADDLTEPFYRGLMQCYLELDRRAEALAVFRRCKRLLAAQLAIAPSAATLALHRRISA